MAYNKREHDRTADALVASAITPNRTISCELALFLESVGCALSANEPTRWLDTLYSCDSSLCPAAVSKSA